MPELVLAPLLAAASDDVAMAALRLRALARGEGEDWSRHDDHDVIGRLVAAARDSLAPDNAAAMVLYRLAPVLAPAPAAAPAASGAAPSPRAAPAAAPAPAPSTFGSPLDVAAMVAALVQAAQDGVPFCEECAAAAATAASAAAEEAAAELPAAAAVAEAEVEAMQVVFGWVELEMLDAAGRPVAGQRCVVAAVDGTTHEARTDAKGLVRIEGIAPGPCRVRWPDLDKDALEESAL